jgi:serine/threonine protein kinase
MSVDMRSIADYDIVKKIHTGRHLVFLCKVRFPADTTDSMCALSSSTYLIFFSFLFAILSQQLGEDMCVLKEFHLSDEKEIARVKREVKALRRLQHPLVAEIQAVFVDTDKQCLYLQLKYYSGGSLLEWLASTLARRSEKEAIFFLCLLTPFDPLSTSFCRE